MLSPECLRGRYRGYPSRYDGYKLAANMGRVPTSDRVSTERNVPLVG